MMQEQIDQLLTAIASILSADYWKTSQEIVDELRSQHSIECNISQIRRLLFRQPFVESRKCLGYRLSSKNPDLIDKTILRSLKKGVSTASVAKKFKISRQAAHQRKQRLLEKAIYS